MNQGKEGGPYEVPDSFIKYLAFVRTRARLDYRTLEGFARTLIHNVKPGLRAWGMKEEELARLKAPSFSQIRRRILHLHLDPKDVTLLQEGDEVSIILDASGVKVTNRSEWIRKHEGNRQSRGWLKLHLGIARETKQSTCVIVTTDAVGDVREGPALIRQGARNVRAQGAHPTRLLGDGGYDARKCFDACRNQGLRPVIRIRAGSGTKLKGGTFERPQRVAEFNNLGCRDWAGYLSYGDRWHIEGKFGAIKRLTGEYVAAKRYRPMQKEVALKVWTHDALLYHDQTGRTPWG